VAKRNPFKDHSSTTEKKVAVLTRLYETRKARSDDLLEMIENHLDETEYTLPISKASREEMELVLGSYYKHLRHKNSEGDKVRQEYGVKVSHLAKYLHVPLKDMEHMIKSGEIPPPMSVFDGERRYSLLQMAVISKRDLLPRPLIDRSKEWYTHLYVQALEDTNRRYTYLCKNKELLERQRTMNNRIEIPEMEHV